MRRKGVDKKRAAARMKGHDLANDPAVGMWADREDMKDVHAGLRKIRTPRYLRDGGSLFSPPKKERPRKRES